MEKRQISNEELTNIKSKISKELYGNLYQYIEDENIEWPRGKGSASVEILAEILTNILVRSPEREAKIVAECIMETVNRNFENIN